MAKTDCMSAFDRLCCKSRKLQGSDFFAKTRNGKQSTIRIISIALPKSPVSFARGDEVPHIFTRKSRLHPAEFLITSAKRLLQHNLPGPDSCTVANRKTASRRPLRCLMTPAAYLKSVSRRGPVNPWPEREPIPPGE